MVSTSVVGMKLLSIPETAERLSCSRGHVYDLIGAGLLTAVDISARGERTKIRLSDEDVDRYIREAAKPTTEVTR